MFIRSLFHRPKHAVIMVLLWAVEMQIGWIGSNVFIDFGARKFNDAFKILSLYRVGWKGGSK